MGGVDVSGTPVGVVVAVGAGTEGSLRPERCHLPVVFILTHSIYIVNCYITMFSYGFNWSKVCLRLFKLYNIFNGILCEYNERQKANNINVT